MPNDNMLMISRALLQDLFDDVSDYACSREFRAKEKAWRDDLLARVRSLLTAYPGAPEMFAAHPGQPEPRAEVTLFADNDERDKFIHACQDFDEDSETDIDYGLLMKWAVAGLLDCDHFTITKKGRAAIDAARNGEPQ
ncbi:hypothetical protein [Burkholderia cenocepacia]|uniref:hypothetical protein n=1 Tax=Burkholderia cenocepacia TaxID=95486 RepID=UPI001F4AD003|nr:hypothetical protein [Burkholderia cenocepacia]